MIRFRAIVTRGKQQGAAMVEMAVCLSLLVLLAAGVAEWGVAYYNLHNLSSTIRDATRAATVMQALAADDTRISDYVNANIDLHGDTTGLTITNTPATANSGIQNSDTKECAFEVTVTGQVTYNFGLWRAIGITSKTFNTQTTMRYAIQPLCY